MKSTRLFLFAVALVTFAGCEGLYTTAPAQPDVGAKCGYLGSGTCSTDPRPTVPVPVPTP